ncbi:MAG: TonB-dependent receptor [Gemmatimonadota bacterium]|nr:TonB-dependent receptor [Gemmatimonadota bacterium]
MYRVLLFRAALAAPIALLVLVAPLEAQRAATAPPAPAPAGRLQGVVVDSIHVGPLTGATVRVGATGRSGRTSPGGVFVIDSVPPGEHVVTVNHPLLDSLYLSLATPPLRVAADSTTEVLMAIPSLSTLIGSECPPATKLLGPSVFAGRVLDAEALQPAPRVRVTIVYTELAAGTDIGLRRMARVRAATTDARGYYRICGLPAELEDATLQAEHGRVKTAEVPVALAGPIGVRSLLIRPVADSLVTNGFAVVTGQVLDTIAMPIANAQVSVEGAAPVTTTNARGEFVLDSLPGGTQALVVRRVGLAPGRTIVDIAAGAPAPRVALRLERAVPRLNPVVVTAQAEALERVGFEDRQKRGMGHFVSPEDIQRMQPQLVTSALRGLPGLRVVPTGTGGYTVQSSRGAGGGCVTYWVDGAPFREMTPGDVDNAFPASQLAAIESYQPGSAPAQFTSPGMSGCTAVVIWTQASVRRQRR